MDSSKRHSIPKTLTILVVVLIGAFLVWLSAAAGLRKAAANRGVACRIFDDESYRELRRRLDGRGFQLVDESRDVLRAESGNWGLGMLPPSVCCVLHNDDEVIQTFAFDRRENYPGNESCPFTPSKEPPP